MLYLKELVVKGFGPFRDETKVSFPKTGAILLTGRYVNSSRSSGSGKSSLLKAVAFALGYCDIPATELKNWGSKSLSVKLTIADDENVYIVTRDPKLSLNINGQAYTSLSTGAEEKLAELLKVPSSLAQILTYRPQRSKGTFLNSTDAEKKEFLSTLLNLDAIEVAGDSAQQEADAIEKNKANLANRMQSIDAVLPTLTYDENQITTLVVEVGQLKAKVTELESVKSSDTHDEVSLLEIKRGSINQILSQVQRCLHVQETIKRDATRLNQEIQHMQQTGNCPTCQQKWDKILGQIETKKSELKKLQKDYEGNVTFLEQNKAAGQDLPAIEARLSELRAILSAADQPLQAARQSWATANRFLVELQSKKQAYANQVAQRSSLETDIAKCDDGLVALKHVSAILSRNGFLSVIFGEVLGEIQDRANTMIGLIPNVDRFSLSINTHSETKSGKLKKSITCKVFKGGKEVSLKNLSGGQLCSLELCADLAISEVIRGRIGSPLGWIALDEAMDGLDVETKKPTVDMLLSKVGGQIFVIDHATEVKEAFAATISVVSNGDESWVE